jgi:hypothetical protein
MNQPSPKDFDYKTVSSTNIIRAFRHWLGNDWVIDPKTHKIRRQHDAWGLDPNTPWFFVKQHRGLHCFRDHRLLYEMMGALPEFCLNCFKVVVMPRTLHELMAVLDMQQWLGEHGKCGIEERTYVNRLYGAYFYNLGLDEGLERYFQVRKAVNEIVEDGEKIPVILKRGCTEYERHFGPSPGWDKIFQSDPRHRQCRELIDAHIEIPETQHQQPAFLQLEIMQRWVEFAAFFGDETYLQYTGGERLAAPPGAVPKTWEAKRALIQDSLPRPPVVYHKNYVPKEDSNE